MEFIFDITIIITTIIAGSILLPVRSTLVEPAN
jgi:hypothetical protein